MEKLSNAIKRRLSNNDLVIIDKIVKSNLTYIVYVPDFDQFCDLFAGDVMHEFIVDHRFDEFKNEPDGDYWSNDSIDDVFKRYRPIKDFIIKKYLTILREKYLGYEKVYNNR